MNGAAELLEIAIELLDDHPRNPRLLFREEVIDGIAACLDGSYPKEHALRVRPQGDRYEIIGGHHRIRAARQKEMATIWCWVQEMSDDDAYMALITDNNQGEMSPLEVGKHLFFCVNLESGGRGQKGGIIEYARQIGKKDDKYLGELRRGYKVFHYVLEKTSGLTPRFTEKATHLASHLAAIHHAPEDSWSILATALVTADWSVEETEKAVKRVKALCDAIPSWWERLNREGLITSACEGKAGDSLSMFKEVQKIDTAYTPVTLHILQETEETKIEHGRELRRWVTKETPYDPSPIFRTRVMESETIPTIQHVRDIHKAILTHINAWSRFREEWRPVLTDEEYAEQRRRDQEFMRLSKLERYTPHLIHADVINGLRQIADESIDLICTDPPYNMDKAEWDTIPEYGSWVGSWLNQCYRVIKPSGCIYIFQRQNLAIAQTIIALESIGFHSLADPPLDRDCVQGTGAGPYGGNRELILFYGKTDEPYVNTDVLEVERKDKDKRAYRGQTYDTKKIGGFLRFPALDEKDPERVDFPTQKPVALLELFIKASCPEGGLVLDCFMGSGSTGVAAMRLERRSIGIDQSRDTLNLAQGRFAQTEVGAAL